jgi:leader peptidase (prepilin peptidase)/N-methyltransferase
VNSLLLAAATILGLVVGSFLNVVIYRVPEGRSIVSPRSSCPGCGHPISPRDEIPVLSWVLLRGRCRHCSMNIPGRYPLVELLTGGLYLLVALRFGWSPTLPAMLVFVSGLVVLAFIDLDHMLLPRVVIYPVTGAVAALLIVAAAVDDSWHRLLVALACAIVETAVLLAIHLISPSSMGAGDVRFSFLIGLALGWLGWWYAFFGFIAANLTGAIVGVALIATGRAGRKSRLPFGVFLSIGAVLSLALAGTLRFPSGG